jgi:hypothetical protein
MARYPRLLSASGIQERGRSSFLESIEHGGPGPLFKDYRITLSSSRLSSRIDGSLTVLGPDLTMYLKDLC